MRSIPALCVSLLLLIPGPAQEVQRFRQWMMGQEAGGLEVITTKDASGERIRCRQWTRIERKLDEDPASPPTVLEASQDDEVRRGPEGSLQISWSVRLSAEPLEGRAEWSPARPQTLRVLPRNGAPREVPVPAGAVLWPGEAEAKMREAARTLQAIHLTQYSFSEQQWSKLDAEPTGPEALPGFPDAVRFKGRDQSGAMSSELTLWISPTQGELKRVASLAGLSILVQRAELPGPSPDGPKAGFFERTLTRLPPHPFMLWMPEVTLRWKGTGRQTLPEDGQQKKQGDGAYQVRRAAPPTPEEAKEPPVKGKPSEAEAPFLAPSPLVPFQDPAFDGLMKRLNPPPRATRWELARLVTSFVYEWIAEKNLAVGFASALEVARHSKGDCTEHGVLAVALLRRLGVPARGAVGWVGLDDLVGLHFWAEVKLGERWVPVDPTFDLAPASALRLKMGTTDLADLGSLGWDTAALSFVDGTWIPEGQWAKAVRLDQDCVLAPEGTLLRVPGARWSLQEGRLQLWNPEAHDLRACIRPGEAQLKGAKALMGVQSRRRGWWQPSSRTLWMNLGDGRWVEAGDCTESQAFRLLDELEYRPR